MKFWTEFSSNRSLKSESIQETTENLSMKDFLYSAVFQMLRRGARVRERRMCGEYHRFKARNAVGSAVCTGDKGWTHFLL